MSGRCVIQTRRRDAAVSRAHETTIAPGTTKRPTRMPRCALIREHRSRKLFAWPPAWKLKVVFRPCRHRYKSNNNTPGTRYRWLQLQLYSRRSVPGIMCTYLRVLASPVRALSRQTPRCPTQISHSSRWQVTRYDPTPPFIYCIYPATWAI